MKVSFVKSILIRLIIFIGVLITSSLLFSAINYGLFFNMYGTFSFNAYEFWFSILRFLAYIFGGLFASPLLIANIMATIIFTALISKKLDIIVVEKQHPKYALSQKGKLIVLIILFSLYSIILIFVYNENLNSYNDEQNFIFYVFIDIILTSVSYAILFKEKIFQPRITDGQRNDSGMDS